MISHQTVRLERGRHTTPDEGMCVMELASVLAGEPFSDRPHAVCPVIGAVLRAYNDRVEPDRRQALIPYASEIVGTRAGRALERERAARCVSWAIAHGARVRPWQWRRRRLRAGRGAPLVGPYAARCAGELAGARGDERLLALVGELIALGGVRPEPSVLITRAVHDEPVDHEHVHSEQRQ
jgi:hypothetical protein